MLSAEKGFRSPIFGRHESYSPTVELDHVGSSRYVCEVDTGSAFIVMDEEHAGLIREFLELKIGMLMQIDLPDAIVWEPERIVTERLNAVEVDDIRSDSEVLWSVILAFCNRNI